MVIPVSATLPDSVLSPAAVARKFQSTSLMGLGSMGVRGLGDTYCDDVGCYDDGTTTTSALNCPGDPGCPGYTPPVSDIGASNTVLSASSTDWTKILQSLTTAGVDIAKLALIQPGTTLTASGAVSRQNPGYQIPGSNTASLGLNTSGSNTTLLLVGLGLAAVLFMSKK